MNRRSGIGRRERPATTELIDAGVAFAALVGVDTLMRSIGYRRTLDVVARLAPVAPRASIDPSTDPRAVRVVRAVDRASARFRAGHMCLRRSLLLWAWLRRRGHTSTVRLGVRREPEGSLVGHAWVEWRGAALFEPADVDRTHVALVRPRRASDEARST